MLKAQNSAAQAAIQGALNGPDHPPKGLFRRIPILHQYNSHLFYLLIGEKLLLLSDLAFYNKLVLMQSESQNFRTVAVIIKSFLN